MVNEVQAIFNPYHDKGGSDQVFLIMDEQSRAPTQEDQGMQYVGNMYCHSNSLQSQHISSKCTSPLSMHNEFNHVCSQQPIYPSYIPPYPALPSSFHPSFLFPSTLSPSHFLSYSLSHSHNILRTPPYPPKETIFLHTTLHKRWLEIHIILSF